MCFVVVAAVWICATMDVRAQSALPKSLEALGQTLQRIAADAPGQSKVSIYVADVMTGTQVFAKNADVALNPASNAKIVTAACALKRLGPEHRFVTSLHGKTDGSAVQGALYLKGHADPTLSTAHLWDLVQELKRGGIQRIDGGIVVDDSYFDGDNQPYAYDQQPNEDASFRAPVGAVSLNYNTLAIVIRPGPQAAKPARVTLDPQEYAVLVNDTVTSLQGALNPKISATRFEDRTKIRVWGQVPLGSGSVTYFRRVDNPSLLAGYGLKGALKQLGIAVGGGVRVGSLPPGTPNLAEHVSEPLSAILWETGKVSNNFVTEMVLKTMGAEGNNTPGTWKGALAAASDILKTWGLEKESYVYRNGSGLFDANRFSSRQLVTVLRAVYLDSSIRPEFLSQLATGGVDGTIKSSFREKEAFRRVRAKTGTLADVSALSGYVFDGQGRQPIVFSILVNEASGYVSASRTYEERIVGEIARFLNP